MAEEREVPVGEPAQQVRDVVRAGDLRGVRGAVGIEQAVGEQPVGERAGLAGHGRGVADDLADVVQHPRHVRVQAGGGRAAEIDVDPRLGDRPGGGAAGSASGSTACSSPSGVRSTTTMGWITRRASPPVRRTAARTDSTR